MRDTSIKPLWAAGLILSLAACDGAAAQLADKAEVSPTTVAHIETGSSVFPTTATKLAAALGVKPSDLMEG